MLELGNELADTCSPGKWHDASLVEADNTSSRRKAEHTCRAIDRVRKCVESFPFFSVDRGTPREVTNHLTRRGGVLDCSVNSKYTSYILSTCTSVFTHGWILDHVTRRLGRQWNPRENKLTHPVQCTL